MKSLSVGIAQQRTTQAMGRLDDDLRELDLEMDSLIRQGTLKTSSEYKVLEGQRNNLINRKMNAKYTLKAYPYLKQNVEDALLLSAAQLGAREYLAEPFGLDPMTAEALGLVTMAGGLASITRWVGGKAANFVSAPKLSFGDSAHSIACLLYTSPSPRDLSTSRMPSSA